MVSSILLGTLLHTTQAQGMGLSYQCSQEQAKVWAVRYGGAVTTETCLAQHKALWKTKPNLSREPYLTSMCVCVRQAALEDSVMFLCVFEQSLAQQSP